MPEQMPLNLARRAAHGREDFFVSTGNAMAVAMLDGWRNWPNRKLVLTGPKGAGKTHLACVWATESGARIVPARDLPDCDVPALAQGPVCVEDLPEIAGQPEAEAAMFHLHNLALAEGQSLLVTAASPPRDWPLSLPDLRSRMQGTSVISLPEPDDMLLTAVLAKLFADRLTVPAADVIPYLVLHMPRSFEVAGRVVERIDRLAMGTRSGVTRAKARRALTDLMQEQDALSGPAS